MDLMFNQIDLHRYTHLKLCILFILTNFGLTAGDLHRHFIAP